MTTRLGEQRPTETHDVADDADVVRVRQAVRTQAVGSSWVETLAQSLHARANASWVASCASVRSPVAAYTRCTTRGAVVR